MSWNVGDEASLSKTITGEDIRRFADLLGDHNPIHVDEEYARTTPFGRPLAHGMLVASLVSSVLASRMPGPGTVYLGQDLRFKAPVFSGDTITAKAVVREIRADKPIYTLETVCVNQNGETVITGQAVVLWRGEA
jgi:3-hydroxybutyryl-CoA dehydratase